MLTKLSEAIRKKPIIGWGLFLAVMVLVFLLGLFAASVTERRAEIASIFNNKKVEISSDTIEARNEIWGLNYPREYETWKHTADMDFRSKHQGNMEDDVLEDRPDMVVLWAGYAFSKDYKAPRGHMHALEDSRNTLRTGCPVNEGDGPQPATCWTCKSPDVPRMMNEMGIEIFTKQNGVT